MRRAGRAPVYWPNSVVAGSTPADVKFAVVFTDETCTVLNALYSSALNVTRRHPLRRGTIGRDEARSHPPVPPFFRGCHQFLWW